MNRVWINRGMRRAAVALVGAAALAIVAPAQAAIAAPGSTPVFSLAPGTAGLTPDLAWAFSWAVGDARAAGVALTINSGKRSYAAQEALWRDGIATYGSPEAARRWVLPPSESTHVSGQAIDVAPRAGAAWLQRNGFRYGLCRTFDNEWWHFERIGFPGAPCPPRYADASRRPRR